MKPNSKHCSLQLKAAIKKYKAKSVFIATDSDPMLEEFQKKIKKVRVAVGKIAQWTLLICVLQVRVPYIY
jgi:uncharacterized protein (DUF885 family)